jgi:hypothetical protein
MRKWLGRLRNAIRPARLEGDLERELRFHVTERIEELQQAGMAADDAARLARRQFGNYTAQVERTRDMDISEGLDAALRNVRLSLRALAKSAPTARFSRQSTRCCCGRCRFRTAIAS